MSPNNKTSPWVIVTCSTDDPCAHFNPWVDRHRLRLHWFISYLNWKSTAQPPPLLHLLPHLLTLHLTPVSDNERWMKKPEALCCCWHFTNVFFFSPSDVSSIWRVFYNQNLANGSKQKQQQQEFISLLLFRWKFIMVLSFFGINIHRGEITAGWYKFWTCCPAGSWAKRCAWDAVTRLWDRLVSVLPSWHWQTTLTLEWKLHENLNPYFPYFQQLTRKLHFLSGG